MRKRYSGLRVYGQSKLMNVLFTDELARRLAGHRRHRQRPAPGGGGHRLGQNTPGLFSALVRLAQPFMRTPEKGAETLVYLATSPEVEGVTGKYFRIPARPCRPAPRRATRSRRANSGRRANGCSPRGPPRRESSAACRPPPGRPPRPRAPGARDARLLRRPATTGPGGAAALPRRTGPFWLAPPPVRWTSPFRPWWPATASRAPPPAGWPSPSRRGRWWWSRAASGWASSPWTSSSGTPRWRPRCAAATRGLGLTDIWVAVTHTHSGPGGYASNPVAQVGGTGASLRAPPATRWWPRPPRP